MLPVKCIESANHSNICSKVTFLKVKPLRSTLTISLFFRVCEYLAVMEGIYPSFSTDVLCLLGSSYSYVLCSTEPQKTHLLYRSSSGR